MIPEERSAGHFYALQMMKGMDCTTLVSKSCHKPAINEQNLIHWNLHLLAYASPPILSLLPLGQKGDHKRGRGKKESNGDDSRHHSSDESSATLNGGQEEKAMVADLEIDGWQKILDLPGPGAFSAALAPPARSRPSCQMKPAARKRGREMALSRAADEPVPQAWIFSLPSWNPSNLSIASIPFLVVL